MTEEEVRLQAINPVVQENVAHNSTVITIIRSLTASLFGIAAGILGLTSLYGFAFYLTGTIFVSQLIIMVLANGEPSKFFESSISGVYTKDVVGGLMSFVLTWTLFGLVGVS